MNKTINQLSDLTQVENDDELVVWDITAGTSKKAKARQFKNIFISASSTTVTGAGIVSGSVVKIMFTSAITGSDTTTGMSISYNGTSIPVKVGKQGSLVDFVAHDISGTYTYLQAYTTLELAFDGTQFVVIGNPIVLSSDDYTIYADGYLTNFNYSTSEQKTGKKDTDGKDIYRRTLIETGLAKGNQYVFTYLPSNVYKVKKIEGIIDCDYKIPINTNYSDITSRIVVRGQTVIVIADGSLITSIYDLSVDIEYTKS